MAKKLFLESGESFAGKSFGADANMDGEVVFTTGMTGYLEILTDPSYYGQIVVFTFPLIGNYGVFAEQASPLIKEGAEKKLPQIDTTYESQKIWVKGVILTEVSEAFSHCQAFQSFSAWLNKNGVPGLSGLDTRELTQTLREKGCVRGAIADQTPSTFEDPLKERFVPEVSPQKFEILEPNDALTRELAYSSTSPKTIAFMDCGAKNGIFRNFLKRGIRVLRFPFDQNPFESGESFDGVFLSNGPGDPSQVPETIEVARQAIEKGLPTFGICLGNQMLALASGGTTKKMKYGHRGVNQPCQDLVTKKCIITSQNHGFEVDEATLSKDFEVFFKNLNDGSVEGIRHKTKPIFSVQFHPEACAGPEDAEYLFDEFVKTL